MRLTMRTMMIVGLLAVSSLLATNSQARAQCCGGGGTRGSSWGGHTFARSSAYGGNGRDGDCSMSGMSMGGMGMPMMNMQSPNMAGMQMPAVGMMQGMIMGGYTAPAPAAAVAPSASAAGTQYYCPMHPNVVSSVPGTCPYCHMPLQPR